jgi:signal transduction histidine kinase
MRLTKNLRGSPGSDRTRLLRMPRRTVRLRLTCLYGALFLASGTGLLVITNLLVRHTAPAGMMITASSPGSVGVRVFSNAPLASPQPGSFGPAIAVRHQSLSGAGTLPASGSSGTSVKRAVPTSGSSGAQANGAVSGSGLSGPTSEQPTQAMLTINHAEVIYRQSELHELLEFSLLALAVMGALSIALGWLIAGKVLRPLRTITGAAKQISATNLHQRLALAGPDDELKELGDTFDDLLARLDRSFQAQRRFVAHASHELRTPLARQRAVAQVALADPDATVESLRVAHERVLVSGVEQEQLIEALLTLARGESGCGRQEPVDLAATVEEALLTAEPEIERRGLGLETEVSEARLVGDPRLVERLVTNLVDNAVRHNVHEGGITVSTATGGSYAVLRVANSGPAIALSDVERLTQPFQRLNPERTSRADGLGLGLSIVKAIAEAHGAVLAVRPRSGGGLEVEVRFQAAPVGRPVPSPAPDRPAPDRPASSTSERPGDGPSPSPTERPGGRPGDRPVIVGAR